MTRLRRKAFGPRKFIATAALLLVVGGALAQPCRAGDVSPRQLVEVADLNAPVISPDGSKVAFRLERASVDRDAYDSGWYVQPVDGAGPAIRVGDGGTPLRDSAGVVLAPDIQWSPDGRSIYYRALLNGRVDVWMAAADGSAAAPVTSDPADVRTFRLSADGTTLFYSVGATRRAVLDAEQAEYDRGVHLDATTPLGQPLFRSGFVEGRLATQRYGGAWFDRGPLLSDVPDAWSAIDLTTGTRRPLADAERHAANPKASDVVAGASSAAFDAKADRAALLRSRDEVHVFGQSVDVELLMVDRRKGDDPLPCRSDLCMGRSVTSLAWRPESNEVLFTVSDPRAGLAQSILAWDVETGVVRRIADSPGLLSGGRDLRSPCGVSNAVLACVVAEAGRPPRLERIDLDSGERKVLFDPNAALALSMADRDWKMLRWTDEKGQAFTGQYFPARGGPGPSPLFVTYYVCSGFLRGGVGDEWPLAVLAQQGVSALCINRPANAPADRIELYDQALSGVESAVDYLAAAGEVDRTHVGMGGLSFGSAVTLWTAIESDVLTAASVTSPVVSPLYYLYGSLKGDVFTSGLRDMWGLGAPDETPARWRRLTPTLNLDRIETPILMQTPEQEYLMTLDYAIPLIRRQQADLYVFPNEPHQKFQPRHKLAAYERNLDWFRFWLQDYEDPDPAKAEQYRHWREMRAARDQSFPSPARGQDD